MSFKQLNPQIPVFVLDKGKGYALGVIDYSQDHSLLWVVALNETGEIWTVPNEKIRALWNSSMNRIKSCKDCDIPIMDE